MRKPEILATDLDGTLIPLPDDAQNQVDLETLTRKLETAGVTLVYITGRHFTSALDAIDQFRLPNPAWLICDVGTSIFQRVPAGGFQPVAAYQDHQSQITASLPITALRRQLEAIAGLRMQESEKQGRFKLSYYADAARLDELADRVQQQLDVIEAPYSLIHSIDPFNGDGLIDLLPHRVSKAHALAWWAADTGVLQDAIIFAGDSGNDLAALCAGYRAIVVGNADRSVASRAIDAHRAAAFVDRLYLASSSATSGVLEACYHFGLFATDDGSD